MKILFFAHLRKVTGCDEISLEPEAPLTGDALWVHLLERFPGLSLHRPHVRLARNWEYTQTDTIYTRGDEIALIPPVSGG